MGQPSSPTFTWAAAAGAGTYDVEIATDSGFSSVVYSANGLTETSHTAAVTLAPGTVHHWRVSADNACGAGPTSVVFSFTTSLEICASAAMAIPDGDPGGASDSMVIATGGYLEDLNVTIRTTHGWVGDIGFSLEHVATGTTVSLMHRPGVPASTYGCDGDDVDATFDDGASNPVEDECGGGVPTIGGPLIPDESLAGFAGENLAGTWTLTATDYESTFAGTLDEWCLKPEVSDPIFADGFESGNTSAWSSGE